MKKSLGYNLPLKPHFFHDSSRSFLTFLHSFSIFRALCATHIKTVFHHNFRMTKKGCLTLQHRPAKKEKREHEL